jgi:acyl-CoA reductase-like NAD-dependent aldehyde dehydrogenase
VFVQEDFHDRFADALTRYTAGVKSGDPFDPKTTVGPLVSKEQFERVKGYLDIGKKEGAKVTAGGDVTSGKGYFVNPTVFTDVKNNMKIAREEIFGPVASVIPFKDENDAVLQGNDTTYGLAAAVWTNDVSRAHRVARALKAGTVWVNCYNNIDPISPFGGYKQSGIGRELGRHSLDLYTQIKSVYVKL